MSDNTEQHDALEEAIGEYVKATNDGPAIVTDWVVLTAYQGLDDSATGYIYAARTGMAAHAFTGLIAHHLRVFQQQHINEALGEDE